VKARYYCGNCSREVSSNASMCPYCGSSFTAVRCPKCSYEGKPPEFRDGCPACGYMMSQEVRVPVMPAPKKPRPQTLMSRRFYRISGLVLLALFAVLIVLLLIKP
jgi:Double zinc ribbon